MLFLDIKLDFDMPGLHGALVNKFKVYLFLLEYYLYSLSLQNIF